MDLDTELDFETSTKESNRNLFVHTVHSSSKLTHTFAASLEPRNLYATLLLRLHALCSRYHPVARASSLEYYAVRRVGACVERVGCHGVSGIALPMSSRALTLTYMLIAQPAYATHTQPHVHARAHAHIYAHTRAHETLTKRCEKAQTHEHTLARASQVTTPRHNSRCSAEPLPTVARVR